MRVIEVSIEQRWNERAGETGDARENPPTSGIIVAHQGEPLFNARPGYYRIFASGNRVGRRHWSAGFPGNLPYPHPFHSGAATF
ncbi:hypothetical protein PR048_014339 [Dryococelus australis]|uniref:Uncharacterized protein n=1 Tax=Dryococelus australis TaxID=614101 RepID=A0ABQ9HDZ2_9NEOP|nr:hypothetical protein PR048_014339 [Dryococelus australis]